MSKDKEQVYKPTRKGRRERITVGQWILSLIMFLFVLICILPFFNVVAMSLSSKSAILRGDVTLWPVELSTKAYEVIVKDSSLWKSLFFTVKLTLIYTVIAMVLTVFIAYPLTMKRLKGRKFFTIFIVFTM